MFEITTTSTVCLREIKEEPEFEVKLEEFSSEQDLSIVDNLLVSSKVEIDAIYEACNQLHQPLVKEEEIKQEVLENGIKLEDIVDDNCVSFNTDISSSLLVNIFYYCDQCNYSTNDKIHLADHIFTHRFKCNQCSYTTPDNHMLINHKQIHFMIGSLQCNVCNYTCIESRSLDEHMSSHIGKQFDINEGSYQQETCKSLFECDDCGYKTISKFTLKFHMKTHKKIDGLKSNESIYSKNSIRMLPNGQITNTTFWKRSNKAKVIKCKTSTNIKHFRQNLRHKTINLDERRFSCNQCNYKTNNKYNFKAHKYTHSNKSPFKCNLCEFSSKYIRCLNQHLVLHTGELPFKCDSCSYKCATKGRMSVHKKMHAEKTFKCHLCDYRSFYLKNLKVHLRRHSGERPFSCSKCDYTTHNKSQLYSHKIVHSEKKPFKCNLCHFRSRYSRCLKEHLMIHFGDQPFSCDQCDYKTITKSRLRTHKKVHERKSQNISTCATIT